MTFPDISPEPFEVLVLVVPHTEYHTKVPLLVGTNIRQQLLDTKASQDVPCLEVGTGCVVCTEPVVGKRHTG